SAEVRTPLERAAVARDPRLHRRVRRTESGLAAVLADQRGLHSRIDRTERGREDDGLQHADRNLRAGGRRDRLRWPESARTQARASESAGYRAHVSEHPAVRESHRVRERAPLLSCGADRWPGSRDATYGRAPRV